jgi:predicted N-acetyltransferase YhbS
MNTPLSIRSASRTEFETVIGWASKEGWNPGCGDLEVFYNVDPDGFLMGWIEDEPVSSISVVRYGDDFGFLGFYIVHPDHRGAGIGLETWNAGMAHLGDCSVGLDGVVEQQDNYAKSGFDYIGRNVRFIGEPVQVPLELSNLNTGPLGKEHLSSVLALDKRAFGTQRNQFLIDWCLLGKTDDRHSFVAFEANEIVGFATIRKCVTGYKIAPLFSQSAASAACLFNTMIKTIGPGHQVTIDVPMINKQAKVIAERAGLHPAFETARMVRGSKPQIDWNQVFGITSFELG